MEGSFTPTSLTKDNRRPGSNRTVKRKQSRSTYESWKANQEWGGEHDGEQPDIDYEEEILPGLENVLIRRIAEAMDLSMSYAAAVRNGQAVPHRRHWPALLELANEEDPQRELKEKFEDVKFEEDILPELQKLDLKHKEIADAVGLSRSFVSDVLRGEKTPSLEYWEEFTEVGGMEPDAHR